MTLGDLPALNATLNGTSAVLLTTGYVFIRSRQVALHKLCMLAAFATSVVFLVSYLIYHFNVGSVRFPGRGWPRVLYLSILGSHTVLAVTVVPLALRTLWLAWKEDFDRHRRIARVALPIWLYVSVTGVVVYCMLYRMAW